MSLLTLMDKDKLNNLADRFLEIPVENIKNYWKHQYKGQWEDARRKEEAVKELIESNTGYTVEYHGLGAGSDEFIDGSAEDNDQLKGDADLIIQGTNIKVEVTGANKDMPLSSDIWIRPDKIDIVKTDTSHRKVVVHITTYKGKVYYRLINIGKKFLQAYDSDEFPIIHPTVRGNEETYVSIPADSSYVTTIDKLIEYLKGLA